MEKIKANWKIAVAVIAIVVVAVLVMVLFLSSKNSDDTKETSVVPLSTPAETIQPALMTQTG